MKLFVIAVDTKKKVNPRLVSVSAHGLPKGVLAAVEVIDVPDEASDGSEILDAASAAVGALQEALEAAR